MHIDFNADWKFYKDGNESGAYVVNLPHDAMLTEIRYKKTNNGDRTGYFPGGKYVYEKEFDITVDHYGKYIELFFEGVYRHATVIINGKEVAYHAYGYTEFQVDITNNISIGKNLVRVLVDNSLTPNSRWYSGSGIYRPVTLIVKDKNHIKNVKIDTVSSKPAIIRVNATIVNSDQEPVVEIYDKDIMVASGKCSEIEIHEGKLWSEDSPYLYTAVVKTETDEVRTNFGIRKIEWSAKTGLLINGIETKLRGCCIHHDNGILGACGFADAEERRVRIIKESGYNAIRSSHNPCSRALLDACDRYGVYVMDEIYDGWYIPKTYHDSAREFYDNYHSDMKSMIVKDYNHPSVIMYSIGNEVSEPSEQNGNDMTKELVDLVRKYDYSRPVTCGVNIMVINRKMTFTDQGVYKKESLPDINPKKKEKATGSTLYNLMVAKMGGLMSAAVKSKKAGACITEMASHLDIVGLNYGDTRYDIDGKLHPQRIMVGTETMVERLWYNWPRVMKYKYLIGDFVWTGFDYLGETNLGHWNYPSMKGLPLLNGGGTIDILGNRDAENYYQQVIFGLYDKPYICVRPVTLSHEKVRMQPWRFTDAKESWNWQGYEGKKAIVEVFSSAYKIELMLNGKTIAKKKVKKYRTLFKTQYKPGTLKAVAFDASGNKVSENELVTGEKETILSVYPEKTTLQANGQDLCYIPIALTDELGQLKPAKDVQIRIGIEGEAVTLAGTGSANPETDELFDKPYHDTYFGRAMAVLRAGYKEGRAVITVSADGLVNQKVIIQVKK